MKNITIQGTCVHLNASAQIEIGPVKLTIICQLMYSPLEYPVQYDKDFVDVEEITFMGRPVENWKKFCDVQKELGVDFRELSKGEFEEVFTDEVCFQLIADFRQQFNSKPELVPFEFLQVGAKGLDYNDEIVTILALGTVGELIEGEDMYAFQLNYSPTDYLGEADESQKEECSSEQGVIVKIENTDDICFYVYGEEGVRVMQII